MLGGLLGLAVFLLVGVSVTLGGRVTNLTHSNSALSDELFKYEQELKQLRPQLAATERELQMLMEGRFPNLHPLEPDAVIPVQERYVKNIVFTVITRGTDELYEYKLVMENGERHAVTPNFRVLVFDKLGVQVGVDEVLAAKDLAVGESRSHSSTLDVFMNGKPRYFALDFKQRPKHRATRS